jgi:hypothetical protein
MPYLGAIAAARPWYPHDNFLVAASPYFVTLEQRSPIEFRWLSQDAQSVLRCDF